MNAPRMTAMAVVPRSSISTQKKMSEMMTTSSADVSVELLEVVAEEVDEVAHTLATYRT